MTLNRIRVRIPPPKPPTKRQRRLMAKAAQALETMFPNGVVAHICWVRCMGCCTLLVNAKRRRTGKGTEWWCPTCKAWVE
jgi:hypothetical protein